MSGGWVNTSRNWLRTGLMGLAFCNSGAVVAPFGGTGRALGTNPFAWAAPGAGPDPLVLDFSTAGVAEGKLRVAGAEGREVAAGLIVDSRGRPTTRPEDFFAGGALLPFGGHKGSGMSIMIELLGGLLTGMGTAPTPGYAGGNGTVLLAVSIAAFTSEQAYREEAAAFCAQLVEAGAGPTGGSVLLPGELESRTRRERLAGGDPGRPGRARPDLHDHRPARRGPPRADRLAIPAGPGAGIPRRPHGR